MVSSFLHDAWLHMHLCALQVSVALILKKTTQILQRTACCSGDQLGAGSVFRSEYWLCRLNIRLICTFPLLFWAAQGKRQGSTRAALPTFPFTSLHRGRRTRSARLCWRWRYRRQSGPLFSWSGLWMPVFIRGIRKPVALSKTTNWH